VHCVSRCFGAFLEPVVGAISTLLRLHCLLLMVRGAWVVAFMSFQALPLWASGLILAWPECRQSTRLGSVMRYSGLGVDPPCQVELEH